MRRSCACLAAASALSSAAAQEAINMDAATHPSRGVIYLREQIRYFRYDAQEEGGGHIDRYEADTWLTWGARHDLAVQFEAPVIFQRRDEPDGAESGDGEVFGPGDPSAFIKYRFFTRDIGPVDTLRASALAGVEAPFGAGELSSHSWDPFVGAVATWIGGRHGASAGFRYKFNTGDDRGRNLGGDGPDDALDYDASYLFRLIPAQWDAATTAATYLVLEFNGLYETGGDNEILLSPGLLYEARHWAAEVTFQAPLVQDVRGRPELDWAIGIGLRLSF